MSQDLLSKSRFTAAGRGQLSTPGGYPQRTYFVGDRGGRVELQRRGAAAATGQYRYAEVLVASGNVLIFDTASET